MAKYDFFGAAEFLMKNGVSPMYLIGLKKKGDAIYSFKNDYAPRNNLRPTFKEDFYGVADRVFGKKQGSSVKKYFTQHERIPLGLLLLHLAKLPEGDLRQQFSFFQDLIVGFENVFSIGRRITLPCDEEPLEKLCKRAARLREEDKLEFAHRMSGIANKLRDADVEWEEVVSQIKKGTSRGAIDFLQAVEFLMEKGVSPAYLIAVKKEGDTFFAFKEAYARKMKLSGKFEENFSEVAQRLSSESGIFKGSGIKKYFTSAYPKIPMGILLLHLATIPENGLREQLGFWKEFIVGMENAFAFKRSSYGRVKLPTTDRAEIEKFYTCLKKNMGGGFFHPMKSIMGKVEAAEVDWKKVVASINAKLRMK